MTTALVSMVLLSVFLSHRLFQKEIRREQSDIESKLPEGKYLPDADNPMIRVVIKNNGFAQAFHNEVVFNAANGLIIKMGDTQIEIEEGASFALKPNAEEFKTGSVWIMPKVETDRIVVNTLSRGYGVPSYRGTFELFSTAEGIVMVNELPAEEYLYAVVPSEMPASYEPEALKCQAICARSYAYCQMLTFAYPEYSAHVDDSTSFQVYGNSKEQESTNQAIKDTAGQRLWYRGNVVKTYYYSTSCGKTTSIEAWGTEPKLDNQYLCSVNVCTKEGEDYEKELPWYRWEAVMPQALLSDLIELNTGKEIGKLQNVTVTKRGPGDIALQITAKGTKGTIVVDTENKIRKALGGEGYQIKKQDGSLVKSGKLLPSAFFTIEKNGENYIIKGGGYGHGIGMSQNGAHEMAKTGKTYEEILTFFYPGTKVR